MCEEKTRRTKVVYLVSVWILTVTVTGIKVHSYTNCKWKVCLDFTNCEDIIDKKSLIYLESKAGERIDLATHWSFKACPLPVLVAVGESSVAEKYHSLLFLSEDLRIEKKKRFSKPDWRSLHIQPGLRIFWEEGKIQENRNKSLKIKKMK